MNCMPCDGSKCYVCDLSLEDKIVSSATNNTSSQESDSNTE